MQGVCMAAILMAACWFDIRHSKIPNGLILMGWTISLLIAVWQQRLPCCIAGILIVLVLGFPLHWSRAIGAGDVKLLSVLAGIHGVKRSVLVFAAGILLAAVAGVFVLAGYAFGVGRRRLTCRKGSVCIEEVYGEAGKGRPGRHRIILAPFLALAYFMV